MRPWYGGNFQNSLETHINYSGQTIWGDLNELHLYFLTKLKGVLPPEKIAHSVLSLELGPNFFRGAQALETGNLDLGPGS